jgi:cysteine desulfurase / selenocysteine lyase
VPHIAHDAIPFTPKTMQFVRGQFAYLERDPYGARRLFFENSGGSLRIRRASERALEISHYPDGSSRPHKVARDLARVQEQGEADLLAFFGGDPSGALLPTATASQAMFTVVRAVAENVAGTNIVTTAIEHPSSYDACARYADPTEQELRVAQPDRTTGGVDPSAIADLSTRVPRWCRSLPRRISAAPSQTSPLWSRLPGGRTQTST